MLVSHVKARTSRGSARIAAQPSPPAALESIWAQYSEPYRPRRIEELGNYGGFSGARLWRSETDLGPFCLRAWPREYPTRRQLAFIHRTLTRVRASGLDFVPAPVATRDGATFVQCASCFWELAPWMPGVADYHKKPSLQRLRSAMHALARFHLAAAAPSVDSVAPSPTLKRRFHELQTFLRGAAAEELMRSVPDGRWPEMDQRSTRLLRHLAVHRDSLEALLAAPIPSVSQQPVIRDIWHDHVLFEGTEVKGVIDFGTMSVDTVSVDIARLLGSLVDGDEAGWREGLRAYREIRPLSVLEQDMLITLDRSGVFAGGLVWLRWHYLEKRTFENRAGVLARVDHFLERLEAMAPRSQA